MPNKALCNGPSLAFLPKKQRINHYVSLWHVAKPNINFFLETQSFRKKGEQSSECSLKQASVISVITEREATQSGGASARSVMGGSGPLPGPLLPLLAPAEPPWLPVGSGPCPGPRQWRPETPSWPFCLCRGPHPPQPPCPPL